MADGRWPMADGRWPMADGRWPMADRCHASGYEIAQANGHTRGKAYMGDVEY
jgi:hypothetical protein